MRASVLADLGRPVRVLLVEDDEGDVLLMRSALEGLRAPVDLCHLPQGDKIMDYLMRQGEFAEAPRPDLIFMDVMMHRKDGIELLSMIKQDPYFCSIPVIVLSSSSARKDVARAYQYGASAYITKPATFTELKTAMAAMEQFWFHTCVFFMND